MTQYSIRGKLLIGTSLVPGALVVDEGRIVDVIRGPHQGDLPEPVLAAEVVAPGFIDLQVNGGFGWEAGSDPEALRQLAARLPETGVTSFLGTIVSSPPEQYDGLDEALRAAQDGPGARLLGLHLEGPFLSPLRPGAHRVDVIRAADDALFERLLACEGMRLMTVAPETPGALERIRRLRERGVVVALGHTDASYDKFRGGVEAGATLATHLYNAMAAGGHRTPAAVAAALLDDRIVTSLIPDGVHSHPVSVELALRVKGVDRIALITDLMVAAGMPPGVYRLGPREVINDGHTARLTDGTLAGALAPLDTGVRNLVSWGLATPGEALHMASQVPARVLGLESSGRLAPGCDADLVLLDDELRVQSTIVRGAVCSSREDAWAR
jgi:N-acetylglucosamine-6-phosphate deacetylase